MLPVLKKPFETGTILKILQDLRLGHPPTAAGRIALDKALSNGWIEFWYQPKIDLRKKQLVGVEAFARARHPHGGVLMPSAFLPGATEADLIALSEQALAQTLKAARNFTKLGVICGPPSTSRSTRWSRSRLPISCRPIAHSSRNGRA